MKRGAAIVVLGLLATSPAFATMRSVFRRPVIWTNGRPFFVGENYVEVPIEAWIYNFGPNKLMHRVVFEAGYVVEIETLGYGYIK